MPEHLGLREASEYLRIPKKYIENYVKHGSEIPYTKISRRYAILREDIETWKIQREYRTVVVNRDDYVKCFNFAVESFYTYRSRSDFHGARERGIGKWCEDFIPGKLGEIATHKFLKAKFKIEIQLDFSVGRGIPAQDIVSAADLRRRPKTFNPVLIRTSIKTTKMKNVWLSVPQNEFDDSVRSSDAYIFSRLDLPINHIGRILRDHELFRGRLQRLIPEFGECEAEVVGFARKEGLQENLSPQEWSAFTGIERPHYALRSGHLNKSESEWKEYLKRLTGLDEIS